MANCVVEKKVRYIGSWSHNTVNKDVIAQINNKIRNETGHKVKLQLWRDGIRVHKTSIIQGSMLHELIPFPSIHFLTVSQNTPDFLVVIAKSRDPNFQYQIFAFRCANAMDASMFIEGFRTITRSIEPGHGFNPDTKKTHDGVNWTLRENEKRNDAKRELNQLVNIHGEKNVIQSNGGVVRVMLNQNQAIQNGQVSPTEYKVHMYRKGKPPHVQKSHEFDVRNGDISDSHSEVSESALRTELESLSQELKDIKLLIEKSTGLKTERTTKVQREFEPLEIKVHKTTVTPDDVYHVESPKTPVVLAALDAVVQEEDDRDTAKAIIQRSEDKNTIRVSVPDYRTPAERISTTVTSVSHQSMPEHLVAKRAETSGYGSISSGTSTMSYENWKRHTVANDMSERIQWRARSHASSRPRTTIPSFSSDVTDSSQYVQVRHHTHMVPAYQRVSFDPRVAKMNEKKAKSLRVRGVATTVPKPIEKVYVREGGRHSLVLRPGSVRPALVMQNEPIQNGGVNIISEQNNNVVKVENSDDTLLDVSGIDLYKETPTTQTTTTHAVIRT